MSDIIDVQCTYRREREPFHFLLMSDLHLGASSTNVSRIRRDLESAEEREAQVFINGDIFDAIIARDPRFTPKVGKGETDAPIDEAVEEAADLLEPHASRIRMIGCGNHETAFQKFHGSDLVARLLKELRHRVPECEAKHGGYTGAIRIGLARRNNGKNDSTLRYNVWYHHGFGGAAPVTKGMIDFHRLDARVENADCLWIGHKHNRFVDSSTLKEVIPSASGTVSHRQIAHVMSGSYAMDGASQFDGNGTYRLDWARQKGFAPQGKGGVFMTLQPVRHEKRVIATFEV